MKTIDKFKSLTTKNGYRIIQILSGRSNVFLLTNGEKNILIDTSPERLWNKLEKKFRHLNINHIDYLILTHSHFDHAGNAHSIREKYKALVIIHREEAPYLTTGIIVMPLGTNLFSKFIVNFLANKITPMFRCKPCQYDLLVDTKFDLNDFGFNAYILHTSGHSPGSVSVIIDDEIAIVGDAMFGIFKWSVFPPYAQDTVQMIHSWGKLLETNCTVFIPAHGSANSRQLVQKDYNKRTKEYKSQNLAKQPTSDNSTK